ncbi:uncharacterized protein LOC131663770 [Phymastichus coffea]|uniref:uncharacterized protein LOC131663770 n=1 Tax=Phymastichus coffea TaxID=108790 RepID=UPI00273C365D|nr:uncharacterized protein LOC131663770 [Phymastichus coffea]
MSENRRKLRLNRLSGSETNDIEDISSQSFAGDSGDRSRRSHKERRLSSRSLKITREKHYDSEDYFSDTRHRKEIRNKKKAKSTSKESVQEILSEVDDDKDDDTLDHKKSKKRQKSKKRNGDHSNDSTGERDSSSVRKDSEKSRRKKYHERDRKDELPITEILKKAQEQRTKYEEPAPLPELTTDTIYVQGKHGFSAMKIGSSGKTSRRSFDVSPKPLCTRPINVAIAFQKLWRSIGLIFQGLFGGLALLHFIFMRIYFNDSEEFVNNYSVMSEIYSSTYSFLITLCIITTFDKFDIARAGLDHLREIFKHHLTSILAVPLYLAAFSIHEVTTKVEDKLTLLHYNGSNVTYYSFSNINVKFNELKTWQRMTLSKDALAVLGWVFVSIDNHKNMLLSHLDTMGSYVENPSM